jgi:polysaccharide biosynthesis transport protein
MTIRQLLQVLWGRRGLFLTVFLATVALGALVIAIWPRTYKGEVSVVIDSKSSDPVSGQEQAAELLASTMGTQMDVIASHNVALKVVDKLKLASVPEFQEKFREATDGVGSIRDWLADQLGKFLDVTPSRDSHVINIDVYFPDATLAADLANAFGDAYIQTSLELKLDPSRRQSTWFDEQLTTLRRSLQESQARLSEYQRSKNVSGTNDQMDIENARLAEISNQLIAAQATMYDRQNRLKQMNQALQRDELKELPDLLGNALLQELKAQLVQSESNLAQLGERFGKKHPQYVSAAAQTAALREKLAAEINTARGSISQAAEISTRQEAELRTAMAKQRERILQLKHERDELDVLRHEAEDRQRAYDAGQQRAAQVRLESQLDQSNIAILNPAFPPLSAARPKVLIISALSLILGVIFGISAAITKEVADRRVRSTADLSELAGVTVLAEIPQAVLTRKQRRKLKQVSSRPVVLKLQET